MKKNRVNGTAREYGPGQKVVVAMSGGVDSSVVAALLKNQGYDVIGVFMQFWFPQGGKYGENRCCSLESFNEAKDVARTLDIPLYKLNVGREFKKTVVDDFLTSYKSGKTPNPCVACNKFIKFDLLFKKVRVVFKADYLATGHYVRLKRENVKNKELIKLFRGKDGVKDQSYFLYNLKQKNLKHLLFPLGIYKKTEVRKLAKKMKLAVHSKADSQEICFVGRSHYDFLKKFLHLKAGKITDEAGNILGSHSGLALYTMGQRTGLGLSGGPWYVSGFNQKKNILKVTRDQERSSIFQKWLECNQVNWINSTPKFPLKCQAQIRYRSKSFNCIVKKVKGGLRVEFARKQRAVVAGQSVVFYNGDEVLGGGVIK